MFNWILNLSKASPSDFESLKLTVPSEKLIKVLKLWIIENTRFLAISRFSTFSRICNLNWFWDSNPVEFCYESFKVQNKCVISIQEMGTGRSNRIIFAICMPNENIIVRNLSGPKWRRNGHGPAESIWPMQSFGGHGFKDMVYTEFLMLKFFDRMNYEFKLYFWWMPLKYKRLPQMV